LSLFGGMATVVPGVGLRFNVSGRWASERDVVALPIGQRFGLREHESSRGGVKRALLLTTAGGNRRLLVTFFETRDEIDAAEEHFESIGDEIPEQIRGRRTGVDGTRSCSKTRCRRDAASAGLQGGLRAPVPLFGENADKVLKELPRDVRILLGEAPEVPERHDEALQGSFRGYGCGTNLFADQGEFAEMIARA
jgi:hypothetical protein